MIGLLMLASGVFLTGNGLYAECTSGNSADQADCLGYITGVYDGIALMQDVDNKHLICIPQGVIRGQIKDIAIAYLRDHPATRQESAAPIVANALLAAYPCSPAKGG